MDNDVILAKCLTLLYRESQIENSTENSADLVKTALEKLKINRTTLGGPVRQDVTQALKDFITEMCRNEPTHTYELDSMLQQLRIITSGDDNIYKALCQGIEKELDQTALKRTVTGLKKSVATFYREQRLIEIAGKAFRDLSYGRHNIPDMTTYIQNHIMELEITASKVSGKDTSITRTLDIGDDDSMREVFDNVASSNSEDLAYKTGYEELDIALQGGPRPGDCVVIGAPPHNYKTGMSLSIFGNIATHNKPKTRDPNKKPLLYRATCEDPVRNNAQFLYQYFKYAETGEKVNTKNVSAEEMRNYVRQRLQVNGFHVKIDEVNPLTWTYQSLINRIIQLESEGYSVEVLSIDYLAKIPTTGCTQGSMGDDMLDMFSRVRAFCLAHGILFMTPHQLSTEALRLQQTVPQEQFLKAIKGGGYFEKTKGLGRIYDIGVLINKVEAESGDYLHVLVDKHRFPTVIDAHLKEFFLPFPSNKMPIVPTSGKEDHKILRKIPRASMTQKRDDYDFSF